MRRNSINTRGNCRDTLRNGRKWLENWGNITSRKSP